MMPYAKSIAAFIAPLVIGLFAPLGITGDTSLASALELVLVALFTAATVYFVPNRVQ
jgi:hypothetical protein